MNSAAIACYIGLRVWIRSSFDWFFWKQISTLHQARLGLMTLIKHDKTWHINQCSLELSSISCQPVAVEQVNISGSHDLHKRFKNTWSTDLDLNDFLGVTPSRILRAHGASCRWRSDSRLHARQTCWDGSMRFDWTLQVTVVAAVWFYELLWFLPYFLTFHLLCLSKTLTEVASGAGFSSESGTDSAQMTGSTWIHHIPRCFLSGVYQ